MQSGMVVDTAEGGKLPEDNVVYQINTFGADFTVDGLVVRFDRGDIYRPEFQRNFVWGLPQASKVIESILLGNRAAELPLDAAFDGQVQEHLVSHQVRFGSPELLAVNRQRCRDRTRSKKWV